MLKKLKKLIYGSQFQQDARRVNWEINQYRYAFDKEQYGVSEYPADIRISGIGDCEDYAIAKAYEMRELGYRATLARTYDHAVCLVDGGEGYLLVLDNMTGKPYKYEHGKDLHNKQLVSGICDWGAEFPPGEQINYCNAVVY